MVRLLPIVLLLLATGCSRIKTAYTWLDWVMERQANQYLDLTGDQSDSAEVAIDGYLVWHRSTMLPRYARFLRAQAVALRTGVPDGARYADSEQALQRLYRETMNGVVELMADLLVDQTPAQIVHLEEALAQRNGELREEASADDRLEERREDFEELFEDLVGELGDEQRAAVAVRVGNMNRDPGPWLEERARRNRVVVTLLRSGAARGQLAARLRIWWMGEVDPATPAAYAPYRQRFTDNMSGMIFDLLVSLDDGQRAHLVRRLEEYAVDFEELATNS